MRHLLIASVVLCAPLFAQSPAPPVRFNGYCQRGAGSVTVSGLQSSPATPVQQSYPTCQVAVYITGSGGTLATIYSDANRTALSNPFTAAADGSYFFYANDGRYDGTYSSGGIVTPFTTGDQTGIAYRKQAGTGAVGREYGDKIYETVSVRDFGAVGDGSTDDSAAFAAVQTYLATVGGGRVFIPQTTSCYRLASTVSLTASSITWQGGGAGWQGGSGQQGACILVDNGAAGYGFDTGGSGVIMSEGFQDLSFKVNTTSAGAIRVGSPSTAFNESLFRQQWSLKNLYIDGLSAATPGRIGLSLTQLGVSELSNITVVNFYQSYLFASNTVNELHRIRAQAFHYGMEWQNIAGFGFDNSACVLCEALGPTTGANGYQMKIGNAIHLLAPFTEFETGDGTNTSETGIWISVGGTPSTNNGTRTTVTDWQASNPQATSAGTLLLIDNGHCNESFTNMVIAYVGATAPITIGTNSAGNIGCAAVFTNPSYTVDLLVSANTAGTYNVIGASGNNCTAGCQTTLTNFRSQVYNIFANQINFQAPGASLPSFQPNPSTMANNLYGTQNWYDGSGNLVGYLTSAGLTMPKSDYATTFTPAGVLTLHQVYVGDQHTVASPNWYGVERAGSNVVAGGMHWMASGPSGTEISAIYNTTSEENIYFSHRGAPVGFAGVAGLGSTPVLFSTLPACNGLLGVFGATHAVSDSTTNTWGAAITGTGSPSSPVVMAFCDGANWTVMGK